MRKPDLRYQRSAYIAHQKGANAVTKAAERWDVTRSAIYAASKRYAKRLDDLARQGVMRNTVTLEKEQSEA